MNPAPEISIGRVMAVDPGEKRIGLAISDPLGLIANPLMVIEHVSRDADAARIAEEAVSRDVVLIIVGQPLNSEGEEGPGAKRSRRLANAIAKYFLQKIVLWDESGSTRTAQEAYRQMGVRKMKRRGHLDEIAATVILQSYLEAMRSASPISPDSLTSMEE